MGVIIILCIIFIFIARYLRKEGFDGEINTHAKLNDYNAKRYNRIGSALGVVGKGGFLGSDTRGIMGNIETTMDARGKTLERIDDPYPLSKGEASPLMKSIKMCEKVTTAKCSAFDDPNFSNTCGLCMDIGRNSMDNKAIGGLLLLPKEKALAKENQKGNFLPEYTPTAGSCPAGFFVATKDECLRLEKQLQCQKASTFDSPQGCSQCYGDSSYSIVDAKNDADLIRGSGSLYITGLGILEYSEIGQNNKGIVNLSKMSQPYIINLMGGEMTTINLYLKKAIIPVPYSEYTTYNIDDLIIFDRYIYLMVEGAGVPGYAPDRPGDKLWNKQMAQSEYVAPPPNYLAGYLSGDTSEESSFTFDLFRLIQTDTLSGRKPRAVGSMKMKNPSSTDDVEVTKMGPIYGKKEMKLVMKAPFTFVDPFSQEATTCAGSPFVTKPESARLLASDSCYKKGSGPGTYGMACLQAMFLNNGCTESGSGYPKDNITMATVMYDNNDKPRNLQDISDFVYSNAVTTSTGLDSNGKQLSIRKWSEASVFCTGVAITSPCDIGEKDTGPLSADCLEYLWDNGGENKKVGTTYSATSLASSLFSAGKTDRFCTKAGTMSPRDMNGKDNVSVINYWQTKGGVEAVKSLMSNIHYDANSTLIPEESKKGKLLQCYGIIPNERPSYRGTFQSDSSTQTVLTPRVKNTKLAGKPIFKPDPNLIYRISDNGYTAGGDNATRFPTTTQIILDSRGVIFDMSGNPGCCTPNPAETPLPGSPVEGPFLQPGTKVVSIERWGMPSNPYVIGSLLTIDKPIVNKSEWKGMVFLYTFPKNYKPPPPEVKKLIKGPFVSIASNNVYICTVTSVYRQGDKITLFLTVNSDGSLGAIQRPTQSILTSNGTRLPLTEEEMLEDKPKTLSARLVYTCPPALMGGAFAFTYGVWGYRTVSLDGV